MIRVSIEVDGQLEFDRKFSRFGEGLDDFDKLGIWEKVAKDFYEIEQDAFQSDGHGKWPPLSAKYAEWKAINFPFMPIMRRTQSLYFSLTRRGEGSVYDAKPKELTLGSSIPYARFHMTRGRRRPARKPIDMREEDKRKIGRTIHREMVKFSKGLGFTQTEVGEI